MSIAAGSARAGRVSRAGSSRPGVIGRGLGAVRFDHEKLATETSTAPHNSPGAEVQVGAGQKPGPGLELVSL